MKNIEYEAINNDLSVQYEDQWLEDAKDIDIYLCSKIRPFRNLTDYLFEQVESATVINNNYRSKDTLKNLALNLWVNHLADYPTMYSRSPNNYSRAKRYGKLFFKYDRVINMMDTLEMLGYIEQRLGYFNHEDGIKRRTRAIPSPRLIDLFNEYLNVGFDLTYRLPPKELIILKDEAKSEIDYTDNQWTNKARRNLYRYNNLIQKQDIIIDVPCFIPIKADFIKELLSNLYRGYINLEYLEHYPKSLIKTKVMKDKPVKITYNKDNLDINYRDINYKKYNLDKIYKNIHSTLSTITNKLLIRKNNFIDDKDRKNKILLSDIGVERLVLKIAYSQLHRVFNNNSFELGGRYYGAFHLGMPNELRFFMHVNNSPVVEYDYGALHARMLYHKEKIDYRDDPYEVLCESKEERKMYKLVQLVSINSETEKDAVKALRNEFRKKGIRHGINDKDLYPLVEKFKKVHKPIAKYLTSGVGVELQNIDSKITERLLNSFVKEEIPILPVHDSFVVQEGYGKLLEARMNDFYEKEMGHEPVIERKELKVN